MGPVVPTKHLAAMASAGQFCVSVGRRKRVSMDKNSITTNRAEPKQGFLPEGLEPFPQGRGLLARNMGPLQGGMGPLPRQEAPT